MSYARRAAGPLRNLGAIALLSIATTMLGGASARADVVLLSTSSGVPSAQDANLYDWQGQWVSALDRAGPVPGQLPPWQVNVGLYGNQYTPPGSNVILPDPTCEVVLQISGAPAVQRQFTPCVQGPVPGGVVLGSTPGSPVPELLTPNISQAGNGQHTVTITAITGYGQTSTTSFVADVDNVLPATPSIVGPVGWQRGGEVITSTATTAGPSSISGQYCSINGQPASWYPGATAQLAVTGNGSIPVRCTGQNGAGVAGPTTEFDAMLDNTPPTGAFLPRLAAAPTQSTVAVADALSGVTSGQIQIQTSGGWQSLPTTYSAASGELVATVPDDGSIPDGSYPLRAIVTDAVGNTATITADQNGNPEVITEPLRIVTQLPVGASHALVKRCTVSRVQIRPLARRRQRQPARLVRRCRPVTVPRTRGPLVLRYRQHAAVSGLLQTADGTPLGDAVVRVSQQAAGWTAQPVGTISTDAQGRFTYRIPAGPSRTITFSFPGSDTLRPSAASTTITVRGHSSIKAPRVIVAGRRLVLSGRVSGGFIPNGGVLVQLQYKVKGFPGGWEPFGSPVRSSPRGVWRARFRLSSDAAGYEYRFRTEIHSQAGWPYATTYTRPISRHITRPQP